MGVNILVDLPEGCRALHARDSELGCSLKQFVEQHVPSLDDYFLLHQGKLLAADSVIGNDDEVLMVRCVPRLIGGKGGFGSMLRTIGNQIEKTTNKDACRDLNGRRIRDVKADKAVEEWQKGEAEREKEREEARKHRRERMLAEPKSTFDSTTYLTELQDRAEKTEDSVRMGMEAQKQRGVASSTTATSMSSLKRPASSDLVSSGKRKRATMRALDRFTGVDSGSSDESDAESESSSSGASSSGTAASAAGSTGSAAQSAGSPAAATAAAAAT
ncbi:UBL fusion protein SDE2-like [Sycon ciliatum]|uniref:UBL fusion protein SDE2-like n=1 Tax=Sycon ciliatum TaxID=27933 RepID=UPI0020AD19C3|eukprot:scpid18922/ scgid7988/ UPF0667 protein C1orf55 homolog